MEDKAICLDTTDWKILEALQKNAERLGVPVYDGYLVVEVMNVEPIVAPLVPEI